MGSFGVYRRYSIPKSYRRYRCSMYFSFYRIYKPQKKKGKAIHCISLS